MTEINTLKFNEGTPAILKNKKYGTNWPVVYIINNNEAAYVGETTDASIRSNQHLANKLRRSLDKVYEIIVYSLFSTIVEALNLQVEVSVDSDKIDILKEFREFAQMVMCLDVDVHKSKQDAKVYRVGVTNAADRGLDMYSNWGPAIQIKHLSLDVELAESIVTSIASDRIVIVCKDAEKNVIVSLLTQIGWKSRIQSIVTESDLIDWYERALRGKYADLLGDALLEKMCSELANEFPSIEETPEIIKNRHYEDITDSYWKVNS